MGEVLRQFETFKEIDDYVEQNLTMKEPTSFNAHVRVKKYRITVELVEEPDEVVMKRIQDLWDNCDNHHHWGPLQSAAKEFGLVLDTKTMKSRWK